jgi:hypothetical protein
VSSKEERLYRTWLDDPDQLTMSELNTVFKFRQENKVEATNIQERKDQEERAEWEKEDLLGEFLDAGGTEEDFKRAWPEIRSERIKEQALAAEERAKAESWHSMVRGF